MDTTLLTRSDIMTAKQIEHLENSLNSSEYQPIMIGPIMLVRACLHEATVNPRSGGGAVEITLKFMGQLNE